ncbi:MAG TPA: hypothetical protein VFW40_01385, partial [Capsulimonadaceae bacterium]|nr:hypothetical protein [Capsulimonadaceae bacterium]
MVPKSVTIRPAALADADCVFVLLTQFATSYAPERGKFDNILPDLIASPTACLLVAEDADEV